MFDYQGKILWEKRVTLKHEGFSVLIKEIDPTENNEKRLAALNRMKLNGMDFAGLMSFMGAGFAPTKRQIIFTRNDLVEISVICIEQTEDVNWNWELVVFDDKKGKITKALKDQMRLMEKYNTEKEVMDRAIELLNII